MNGNKEDNEIEDMKHYNIDPMDFKKNQFKQWMNFYNELNGIEQKPEIKPKQTTTLIWDTKLK